jgi:hypothetical protein
VLLLIKITLEAPLRGHSLEFHAEVTSKQDTFNLTFASRRKMNKEGCKDLNLKRKTTIWP